MICSISLWGGGVGWGGLRKVEQADHHGRFKLVDFI